MVIHVMVWSFNLVVHAESYVTVRFVRRRISALAKLEMEPPFQRFAALICTFSLCSLVTELPAWTTRMRLLVQPVWRHCLQIPARLHLAHGQIASQKRPGETSVCRYYIPLPGH